MNPEGSNVKGPSDYGGQKQDVRQQSGNRRGNPNRYQRDQGQMSQNPTDQGQGQSPLGQYRQNSGNQGQQQQGRSTPSGRGVNSKGKLQQCIYLSLFSVPQPMIYIVGGYESRIFSLFLASRDFMLLAL